MSAWIDIPASDTDPHLLTITWSYFDTASNTYKVNANIETKIDVPMSNIYIFIYIYIYMCVCVCMCVISPLDDWVLIGISFETDHRAWIDWVGNGIPVKKREANYLGWGCKGENGGITIGIDDVNSYITFGRGLRGYIHGIDFLHQIDAEKGRAYYVSKHDGKYCDISNVCSPPLCLGVRYNSALPKKFCLPRIYYIIYNL